MPEAAQAFKKGEIVESAYCGITIPLKVMCIADAWAMVRRKGAIPFVIRVAELRKYSFSEREKALREYNA